MDFSAGRRRFLGGRPAVPQLPAGPLKAEISAACLAMDNVVCRSCGDICDAGAIRFRPRLGLAAQPELSLDRCTGCGDCVGICPVRAVTLVAGGAA